ncbi:hypothetical protein HY640_00770 [Candidatus Woesearchaeota archaeon]|nr:hypothetical protein [Candidatus Woesearchaeota archaeon]
MKILQDKTKLALIALCIILLAATAFTYYSYKSRQDRTSQEMEYQGRMYNYLAHMAGITGRPNDIHIHADLKLVINGQEMSLNRQEFHEKNALVHLHLNNPDDGDKVIHIEAKGVTLGHFFSSIGMKLTSNCINFYQNNCNDGTNQLMLFVNGQRNHEIDNYEPKNHDKILLIYGRYTQQELQKHIDSVTEYSMRYN